MSTPSPLVDAFLQALKDCGVNGKSRAPMKESMKNFLSSEKEKKNFERLINAARRHLGTNPRAFRMLNVVLDTMNCRIVAAREAEVGSETPVVVRTSNEAFVLPAVPPVQFPGTPVNNFLVRSTLQGTAADGELPAELLAAPPSWADAVMELLLFEMGQFTTLYELGQVDKFYRHCCVRCLRRLSRMSSRLPPSFYIDDAIKQGQSYVNLGGFSDIWKGRLANAEVCIKVLRYYTSATGEERKHLLKVFHREALHWGRSNHPNVLSFLGVSQNLFDPHPSFCLISPWMDNGCLNDFLKRNPDSDLYKALIETAEGMRYLHELDPPIVHADIRGANILVTRDHRCCLADFGLAAATEMTVTSARTAGSVRWMAPETLREAPVGTTPSVNPTRDIFAFGRTVLEIFTGKPPFEGVSTSVVHLKVVDGEHPARPESSQYDIPDVIWALMNSCWEFDPVKRPSARRILREFGIPPPPDYIILRRPGPHLTVGDLRSKLHSDKEYLVQILPTKDEHPTAELIETISEELRAIQAHLDFGGNSTSRPGFDLMTALTSNIRKPMPRLINPAKAGESPKLLHAKYSSDQNYLKRVISLGEHTPRQAFIDAVKQELHTIALPLQVTANVAGGSAPLPPKAGDLSNFGKIQSTSKGLPMTFGPSSVFSGKKDTKHKSLSRSSSNQNTFSMLSQNPEAPAEAKAAAAPPQRRRLILQPRSKPTAEEPGTVTADATPAGSDNSSEDEEEETPSGMTEEEATKKIGEDSKEFFAVRNLEEADVYFSALPAVHHHRLVEKLVSTAVESKETNAQLVADFFAQVVSKEQCSVEAFEEGFGPLVEILEDIAIDAPKAPNTMALMMKSVSFDSERTARIAAKSSDADKLLALLS